jgi:hypothetical protein
MMLTVGNAAGGAFQSKLYSVGLNASGLVSSLKLVSTVGGLRRPLVPVGPSAAESYAALDIQNRIAVISPLKTSATRSLISMIPKKGKFASSAAFWRDSATKEVRAAVVFENFVLTSGGTFRRYKIEQVFVRALSVDESKLVANATASDFDYPIESRSTIEMGIGTGMNPGVSDLRASADGEAVFGLFPGGVSSQLYRLTATGLTRVSQYECKNFSIGREP